MIRFFKSLFGNKNLEGRVSVLEDKVSLLGKLKQKIQTVRKPKLIHWKSLTKKQRREVKKEYSRILDSGKTPSLNKLSEYFTLKWKKQISPYTITQVIDRSLNGIPYKSSRRERNKTERVGRAKYPK